MKRLYFCTRAPIEIGAETHFDAVLQNTGANSGNLFFMRAVERQLHYESMMRGTLTHARDLSKHVDVIVIPAANWLSGRAPFLPELTRRIENSNLPCVVIGLGAQSDSAQTLVALGPDARRFLKVVSERCHSIGVRGEYSAEVAASAGIHNIAVTGCPSFFWSLSPHRSPRRPARNNFAISVNASRNRRVADHLDPAKRRVERDLYMQVLERDGSFVTVQTEHTEGQLALGHGLDSCDPRDRLRLERFLERRESLDRLAARCRVFTDIEAWIEASKSVDLVIGTRLHACLLGLAAGVPSILITIDSRTEELARLFHLPHYRADSDRLYLGLEDLYQSTDFSPMLRAYPQRYEIYRRFLVDNGLDNHLRPPSALARLRGMLR